MENRFLLSFTQKKLNHRDAKENALWKALIPRRMSNQL
jgi:hypothetical protein